MQAYVFPGQGAQFEGMGADLYEQSPEAKALFDQANDILGFDITKTMFEGSADDLKQTRVAQPALFLHSVISLKAKQPDAQPGAVAGHSLGELSALTAAGVLSFETGLKLVQKRAEAMQQACEATAGTMLAVLGMDDEIVEQACAATDELVVPANYNTKGQLVISGSAAGIEAASANLKEAGAKKLIPLAVSGAFHSPLMDGAREAFSAAVADTEFAAPSCPVYQNVTAKPVTDPADLKTNLIAQITAPVRWTQTIENLLADGVTGFVEVGGKGKILAGMIKKVERKAAIEQI